MDQRSDYIRQDIETTRSALDDKLDALETKARQTFDLKHQVSERPWMALGAAMAAGYVLGSMGGDSEPQRWHGQPVTTTDYNQHAFSTPERHEPSGGDRFLAQFDDEIEMLKSAAISTITTMLRDAIREYVPQMGQQLDRMNQGQGASASGASYTSYSSASRTPSTAPNTSYNTGAGRTGFDSPAETTAYGPNSVASESRTGQGYYPPGSSATSGERDYVKTYHPPSETTHERAVGDDTSRT
jgi:hypothetical protein